MHRLACLWLGRLWLACLWLGRLWLACLWLGRLWLAPPSGRRMSTTAVAITPTTTMIIVTSMPAITQTMVDPAASGAGMSVSPVRAAKPGGCASALGK